MKKAIITTGIALGILLFPAVAMAHNSTESDVTPVMHSSGPWTYYYAPEATYPHRVRDEAGYLIYMGTQEGNARLIAAAPEMKELLQQARACRRGSWLQRALDFVRSLPIAAPHM